MFDLGTTEKWNRLVDYTSSVNFEGYEEFRKEVNELNPHLMELLDMAVAKDGRLRYFDFLEKDKEDISYLYDKYILAKTQEKTQEKKQEETPNLTKSDPVIYWYNYEQFANIISNMSREEVVKLAEGRKPILGTYIESVYTGKGNPINILSEIYLSQENIDDFQVLINETVERYANRAPKEGGVVMEEEKALIPEEKVSQILEVDVEIVSYFEDYVKNLTKEEYMEEAKKLPSRVLDTFYHIYTEKEWPIQAMDYIYPPEAEELRKYMTAKYMEMKDKTLADQTLAEVSKIKSGYESLQTEVRTQFINLIAERLEIEPEDVEDFRGLIRPDATGEELKKAYTAIGELVDKYGAEGALQKISEAYDRRQAEGKEDKAKADLTEVLVEDIHRKIEETFDKKEDEPDKEDSPFADPDVKAKIAKIKDLVDNISPAKYDEVMVFLMGLDNKSEEKTVPTSEEKKNFLEKLAERRKMGKEIARARVEERERVIKGEAAKYRAQMSQYVKMNMADATVEIKLLKRQQEDLLASRNGIKAELEKATKELDELQKEFEESTKDTREGIELHNEKISNIEKDSKALIKAKKRGRISRLFATIRAKFDAFHDQESVEESEEELTAQLRGEKEVTRSKGFFEIIKEGVLASREKTQSRGNNAKKVSMNEIEKLRKEKERLESKLAEAQAKLDAKESEINKAKELGEDKDSSILSEVKDAENKINELEKYEEYLKKLQKRIANLSDRKAYRLSKRGNDSKEGIDR